MQAPESGSTVRKRNIHRNSSLLTTFPAVGPCRWLLLAAHAGDRPSPDVSGPC